ncbi:hypothetical protein D2U88_12930 [Flagellimonas aequoris]|uniref:Uncharacterized protein n=1 Tax=Flagellimonas aequoris TaxID=2306997 RepID=A0A418N5A2_9FLAO|nr:hypothetical protein D2U88_12930 [Allomuricauda aequoris]
MLKIMTKLFQQREWNIISINPKWQLVKWIHYWFLRIHTFRHKWIHHIDFNIEKLDFSRIFKSNGHYIY